MLSYSIPLSQLSNPETWLSMDSVVDQLLLGCIPLCLAGSAARLPIRMNRFYDDLVYGNNEHYIGGQCFLQTLAPSSLFNWNAVYAADDDTCTIVKALMLHKSSAVPPSIIDTIHQGYRDHMKKGLLTIAGDKILLCKPVDMADRCIGLIVVPCSLRRKIFSHYHAGPSGGHMGTYKTLFRLRMWFFWPHMREDIKKWVAQCAHYVSYNIWRSRKSEMHFSGPITVPFWIMHVNLWSPGVMLDTDGNKSYLMNSMNDMTQFVVSSETTKIEAASLAKIFVKDVIMNFGMCSVVVIDDGSTFKNAFMDMCKKLRLHYWCLSRGNHKGNSVERYHRFLNKTQTINGNDRGTNTCYIENAKTSQYAWNSAPIDDTDVPRILAAIGRKFRFPLDVDLSPTPTLNSETNNNLFSYLRDVSTDSKFALSVLQILLDERRTNMSEKHNSGKTDCELRVGDVVKYRVQTQSIVKRGIVGKLSYGAKGPFIITADLGNGSFEVQRYDDPTSAKRKYKNTEL